MDLNQQKILRAMVNEMDAYKPEYVSRGSTDDYW
jgi:hypothetical protein